MERKYTRKVAMSEKEVSTPGLLGGGSTYSVGSPKEEGKFNTSVPETHTNDSS